MSKHSTPMDRKIQKDWAEVMQQFELPAEDNSITAAELVANINKNKELKKPSRGFFKLAFAGSIALSAVAFYSNHSETLSFSSLDHLFGTTTITSNSPKAKVDPRVVALATAPVSSVSYYAQESESKELKPRYITLTQPLTLSVLETLSAKDTSDSYELLDETNWKTYIVSPNNKLSLILHKLNVRTKDSKALLGNLAINKQLESISAGDIVRAERNNGKLTQLITYKPNAEVSFVITQINGQFKGKFKRKVIETHETRTTLFIKNSLRYDANQENIPQRIVRHITKIFDRDVDLTSYLKKGDRLTLVYEQVFHRGNKVANGQVLAAELVHNKRAHRAIRFTHSDGKVDYLDSKGYDLSHAFKRIPLGSYKRVSSVFGKRRHPISHRVRMHTGVDYAAKTGTPVTATANGVVHLVARKGGYGKTIILKHSDGFSTLYGHLNDYAKGLKAGKKVYLGDVIGYVGSTGISTGPHLHYEFRVNGIPKNPETVELPKNLSLTSIERVKFKEDSHNLIRQLDVLQRFAKENVDIKSAIGG